VGARRAGLALMVVALLGAVGVGALGVVHGRPEPVLVVVALGGLLGAGVAVLRDRGRVSGG
jgi:hypothetical protein